MTDNVIYKLSKKFALRIVKLYVFLRDEQHEYVMSRQVYRSGTSVGGKFVLKVCSPKAMPTI